MKKGGKFIYLPSHQAKPYYSITRTPCIGGSERENESEQLSHNRGASTGTYLVLIT